MIFTANSLVAIDLSYAHPDGSRIILIDEETEIQPEWNVIKLKAWFVLPNHKMMTEINVRAYEDGRFNFFVYQDNTLRVCLKKICLENEITEINEENYGELDPDIASALFKKFSKQYIEQRR